MMRAQNESRYQFAATASSQSGGHGTLIRRFPKSCEHWHFGIKCFVAMGFAKYHLLPRTVTYSQELSP